MTAWCCRGPAAALLSVAMLSVTMLAFGPQTTETCDQPQAISLQREGHAAMTARQFDVAAQKLREALAACASDRELLLELADAQLARRDFTAAIGAAQTYVKGNPSSAAGHITLANAYFMSARLKEALAEAGLVLHRDPANIAALEIRGNASYLLGNFTDAKDAFIDVMDRRPNDEDAPYMLGRMYYQEGYVDLAIGQFERVLKINPRAYKAIDNLGLCWEAKGDNDKALRYFLSSIRLVQTDHPDYDWPYANLADLLLKTGDNQKAYDAAAKAAKRNPNSARDFYLGGKALCNLGKTDLCVNWLERSTALDPNYPEPLYLLARVYHKLGHADKSADAQKKFIEAQAKTRDRKK